MDDFELKWFLTEAEFWAALKMFNCWARTLIKFAFSHQSDVSLSILSSDHHQISTEGERGGTQYLSIEVVLKHLVRIKPPKSRCWTEDQMCLHSRSGWTLWSIRTFRIRWGCCGVTTTIYNSLQVSGTIENVRNVQVISLHSDVHM